jgi:hypothetical protein
MTDRNEILRAARRHVRWQKVRSLCTIRGLKRLLRNK